MTNLHSLVLLPSTLLLSSLLSCAQPPHTCAAAREEARRECNQRANGDRASYRTCLRARANDLCVD